jgi:hypothetical protein
MVILVSIWLRTIDLGLVMSGKSAAGKQHFPAVCNDIRQYFAELPVFVTSAQFNRDNSPDY